MTYKRRMDSGKIIAGIILTLISVFYVLPTIVMYTVSFTSESEIVNKGFSIIPSSIDLAGYRTIFKNPRSIISAYGVSLFVVLVGTPLSLFVMTHIAYPLSRKDFAYRKPFTVYVLIVLLFNGGLVPTYIIITSLLGFMVNTVWILIIPMLCSAWNILLLKSYFVSVPISVLESARIDGAGEYSIFLRIVLPLSKSGIATIGTFVALSYWNDWWYPLLYVRDRELYNIQFMLYNLMSNIQALIDTVNYGAAGSARLTKIPTESVRMGMGVLALTPMLFVFPLFQKYFVKGLHLGAVKG